MYSEVREHLRRQHMMNQQEIYGKSIGGNEKFYDNMLSEEEGAPSKSFFLKGKMFLLMLCIMVFSCYLYGGQNVQKGAVMAWKDIHKQVNELEQEQPYVKKTMNYVRSTYSEIKSFMETYFGID